MAAIEEKTEADQIEVIENSSSSQTSENNAKKDADQSDFIPNEARDQDVVTLKTWVVIIVRTFALYLLC